MGNWERTGRIIKETFAMAKKDPALYLPPILNIIVSIVLFIAAVAVLIIGSSVGFGSVPAGYYLLAFLFIFLAYVSGAFFSAALSWMVLETVQGKRPSLGRGLARAGKKTGSLLIYAAISFIIMVLASQLRKNDGEQHFLVAIVKSFFADLLEKAWDIAAHLLLPAIVLTNHNFGSAMKELPRMVNHLPQVLVGGFAFDFVVGWLYIIELVFGILLFFLFGGVFGLLLGIGVFLVLAMLTYVLYVFVKSVYFTMLYIDLHPELKR